MWIYVDLKQNNIHKVLCKYKNFNSKNIINLYLVYDNNLAISFKYGGLFLLERYNGKKNLFLSQY